MAQFCERCGAAARHRLRCPTCHRVLERWPAWTGVVAAAVVLAVQLAVGRAVGWSVLAAGVGSIVGWALGRVFTSSKVEVWSGFGRRSWFADGLVVLLVLELIALAFYDLSYDDQDAPVGLVVVFVVAPVFPAAVFALARRMGMAVWRGNPREHLRRNCRACASVQPWRYAHCQSCGAAQRRE